MGRVELSLAGTLAVIRDGAALVEGELGGPARFGPVPLTEAEREILARLGFTANHLRR